jgi:hypothetical protein
MPKKGPRWSKPEPRRTAGGTTESEATEPGAISNRQARKEEARLRREELKRKEARRRRLAILGAIVGGLLVVGAIVAVILLSGGEKAPNGDSGKALARRERALLAQASGAATAANCTEVQKTPDYPGGGAIDHAHLGGAGAPAEMPPISSYPTQPPASGPHSPTPLRSGVYSAAPPLDQAIHSLEHAAVEVWFAPSASGAELTPLKDFFENPREGYKVIVAPYEYPEQGGTLQGGRQMALVAWHRIQYCDQVSLPVAYSFVHSYRFLDQAHAKDYKGVAREPTSGI